MVKQTEDAAAAAKEEGQINHGCVASVCAVSGHPSLVVPFFVTAEVGAGRVAFCFDPQGWLLQDSVTAGAVPVRLNAVATNLRELATAAGHLNAEVAARSAIARMAGLGLHHKDLTWHHIALVPQFYGGGDVVGVCASVIDLESVQEGVEPSVASTAMLTKLARMIKGKRLICDVIYVVEEQLCTRKP
jgi:hypothetical protein